MEAGIILGDVRTSVPPREHLRDLLVQVEAAQRNGFTSIAIGQHFLYEDFRWLQPIPTLARLAGELDAHVRLAATVIIVPLHHPVVLAEELATLDIVSDGRLIVGAGLGYRKEEFRLLGVDFAERVPRFEEALELMVQLWTADRVTHAGQVLDARRRDDSRSARSSSRTRHSGSGPIRTSASGGPRGWDRRG